MKTLNNYIAEWRANIGTMSSIKKTNLPYFIFEQSKKDIIKIFDINWAQLTDYKDKVYIDGKNIEINDDGRTINKFEPGKYIVEIKDIDKVVYCQYMFSGCDKLISVPLFDTSNVKNMCGMFSGCTGIENIPLFDTKNVENMSYMFWGCEKLKSIPKFNTARVTDARYMFWACKSLIEVPLFNNRNYHYLQIENMFLECDNLNDKTKRDWSKIYDFYSHKKI